ncbi:MAG: hypothetical protein FJX25_06025 [Alphaproteobacteria bacterium]|nr:hypothetical protein [Alphaproteobacteria bacterium]
MRLRIKQEVMGPHMLKVHLGHGLVVHRFRAADHGPHHDHPWPFRSTIIRGGYVEEMLHDDGRRETVERRPGDQFVIEPGHVHRIVALLDGDCWTCIEILGRKVREPGFYEWRDGQMWQRRHYEREWTPLS